MPVSVYPERMDKLDLEDVAASLRTIENYIYYICERTEYAMTNSFRTANGLGSSSQAISLEVQEAFNRLAGLSGSVTELSWEVTGLSGSVTGLFGEVTGLSGSVTGLQGDVQDIMGRLSGVQETLVSISGTINQIRGDITSLVERVTALENPENNQEGGT